MGQPPSEADAISRLRLRDAGLAETAAPQTPQVKALLAYWQSKCGAESRLPSRRQIDALELRRLLPHVSLVDVLPDDGFRVRLLGEAQIEVYGSGLIGRLIGDVLPPEHAAAFTRLYKAVIQRRAPLINRGQVFWWRNKEWLPFESLHAPLASDGVHVDVIFSGAVFGNMKN